MPDEITRAAFTRANRAAWNASAPLHETGEEWEQMLAAAARPGFCVLDETLINLLSGLDLAGKAAVQVGCNNARELLSLAALGLRPVLGIDQSGAFLNQARRLCAVSGLSPRLVEADIYDLPEGLGQHGLALVTIGVVNWMPDLPGFFRAVASLLAEGGVLVIYETHPFLEMFDPAGATPFAPATSYFRRDPFPVTDAISYDGLAHGPGETGYWFVHRLGEIVTSCAGAGLTIVSLGEYAHSNREVDYDIYEGREPQLPLSYSLVARR
ncbi:MAG: class I SAM-dependent methyltransferase [Rhodobacteraceae bacterium]|nr:class I SAM-dependent methyltransferase [Paracoccaceae bacterium]